MFETATVRLNLMAFWPQAECSTSELQGDIHSPFTQGALVFQPTFKSCHGHLPFSTTRRSLISTSTIPHDFVQGLFSFKSLIDEKTLFPPNALPSS